MAIRELQFMDGKSSKFWRIELAGKSHTVTYGRIGTDGTSQTKDFASAAEAQKSHDKLLAQKLGKGYVETASAAAGQGAASKGGAGKGAAAAAGGAGEGGADDIPFIAFPCTKHTHSTINDHASNFMGLRVVKYVPGKKPADPNKTVYFFESEYQKNNFDTDLNAFLDSPAALEARGIVIGPYSDEMYEHDTSGIVKTLAAKAARLPKLRGIFLGDILSEENEISWINQSDLSALLKAFPKLQLLRARGGTKLAFSKPEHAELRALALETGGMDASVVRSLAAAKFPNLEYLELWLGTDDYGGNSSVKDLEPLLKSKKFPKLRYLGLRNCQYVDQIAAAVAKAPLLSQLETLDLSMGVLTDVGGEALLKLPAAVLASGGGSLKRLDLSFNFMSKGVIKQLKALSLVVDTSDTQDVDEEDRFVAVGE